MGLGIAAAVKPVPQSPDQNHSEQEADSRVINSGGSEVRNKTQASLESLIKENTRLLIVVALITLCCFVCLLICCYRTIRKRDITRDELSVYSMSDV
tara:strand:- start:621 stop:911 length:291 start_codon:yes stop_codon:yes gene_type:complete